MGLLSVLKKWAVKLEVHNNSLFAYPVEKQRAYINSFEEPKTDLERAYFQYKCQMKFSNPIIVLALNLAAFPMIAYWLIKRKPQVKYDKKYEAVFFADEKPENIVPQDLKKEYRNWKIIEKKGTYLSKSDKEFFYFLAKQYPFSWLFLLKCLVKISFYSYEIKAHDPIAIVVCNEYSYTSSLLTDYCNKNKIKHINVMHGEKLFCMQDSFFRFDECYVWNETYIKLFNELKAAPNQFIVSVPDSLVFSNIKNKEKKYDYTYYLGSEEREDLLKVMENLNKLANKGNRIAIRPHPRYSNIEEIKKRCIGFEIENINDITIEESVIRTKNAIAQFSTVLNQAFHNGVGVVIDDTIHPDSFKKLQELKYVMLEVPHKLMSDILI